MNKLSSVIAIIIACIVCVFILGVYIERDGKSTFYIDPLSARFYVDPSLVANHEVSPAVSSSGITDSGINHPRIDPQGVIRNVGVPQNERRYNGRHAMETEEVHAIKSVVHKVLGDVEGDPMEEESVKGTGSPSQWVANSTDIKPLDSHVAGEEKAKNAAPNTNRYLPGPQSHFRNVDERLAEIYKKRKSVPPRAAQMRNIPNRMSLSSRLKPQGPRNWRNLPPKLYEQAPVIFDTVPRDFLSQYKNPCWYSTNKQLLCLPYFYILGFPKAGTTDLWDKVNNHPQVSRTTKKETHFWRDHKIGNGAAFYSYMRNGFLLNHRLQSGDDQAVFGDGSATTVISHARFVPYFPNVTAGFYSNVDIIKEITPAAKLIITIREPVERLYSGYLYFPMKNKSAQGFHQEVLDYLAAFKRCRTKYPELRCIYEKNPKDGRAQRLKTSIYEPYIRSWVEGFGFDQIMIVRLEDWKTSCMDILSRIFEFLELAPQTRDSVKRLCVGYTRNQRKVHVGPMLSHTRELLEKFYAPYNDRLSHLLNETIYPYGR